MSQRMSNVVFHTIVFMTSRSSRVSPWPPDVGASDADHILTRSCALVAHNVPARVEPDHQEPQALQLHVRRRELDLSGKKEVDDRVTRKHKGVRRGV